MSIRDNAIGSPCCIYGRPVPEDNMTIACNDSMAYHRSCKQLKDVDFP